MSSSKIKGGGRAILSQESQQAVIDLLMSLEDEGGDELAKLSSHDKKHRQKKFMKRLIQRHEQSQLQQKYNATASASTASADSSGNKNMAAQPSPSHSTSTSSNVRVELAEAIFSSKTSDKKEKKKKSSNDKEKKSDKKKKNKSASENGNDFKVGTKKVIVLPRTTTIPELLKKSKTKLKLKKNPVRAFVQADESSTVFDLDQDLMAVEDGTMLYISVTPPAVKEDEEGKGKTSDDEDDDVDSPINEEDPLESVKRAYQQQGVYRQPKKLERVNEIIDHDKKMSFEGTRSKLPVSSHRESIVNAINENQVVVLSGATGSGKSTQVPQFLLEDTNCHHQEEKAKRPYIVVTQPRKVAAISLAQRVAEERGCPPPGTVGSSVGYMVRSDRRVDLRSCRIIYMTIGILLRMLVNQKKGNESSNEGDGNDNIVPPLSIDTISHLIIDETHERDVNTDFSLTLLKGMMSSPSYPHMPQLILMSATASSELFVTYFSTKDVVPVPIEVPGKTYPVETLWLTDCEKYAGEATTKGDQKIERTNNSDDKSSNSNHIKLSPRATDKIDNRFIRKLIAKIIEEQQSKGLLDETDGPYRATGAVLVFLPGMGEIESLARCLYEKGSIVSNRDICKIMKLHSTVPKEDQRHVFQPAAAGTVKVVLATNIAETSVTIPDISHVIDSCRVKESRYNHSTRIKELVTVWASHASMKQRAGRAGRTSHGVCWRLCSEEFAENELLPHTVPEMARTPLDELILQIGLLFEQRRDEYNNSLASDDGGSRRPFALGFKPIKFLGTTPTPPAEHSLVQACKHLLEVEALKVVDYGSNIDEQAGWLYRLTPLGYHLSRLPMDAKVGKMLIVGCLLGCLDNALTIASALSCMKSCFVPVFSGMNKHVDPNSVDARDLLIENGFGGKGWPGGTVKGDLIAVIAAYNAWKEEEKKNRWKFCKDNALDNMSLCEMETLRKQFFDLMIDAGLVSRPDKRNSSQTDDCNIAKDDAFLTSCCIVGGLYPNVCTLIRPTGPRGRGSLLTNDSDATCRPSSSSFQRSRVQKASQSGKDVYAMYHAKHRSIGTASSRQKRQPETFLSEVNFVSKFALILFGGGELELVNNAIIVDKWLKFKVSSDEHGIKQNAALILSLRKILDRIIVEHVVETFLSLDEKAAMVKRHKRVIEVVHRVLIDEAN